MEKCTFEENATCHLQVFDVLVPRAYQNIICMELREFCCVTRDSDRMEIQKYDLGTDLQTDLQTDLRTTYGHTYGRTYERTNEKNSNNLNI